MNRNDDKTREQMKIAADYRLDELTNEILVKRISIVDRKDVNGRKINRV